MKKVLVFLVIVTFMVFHTVQLHAQTEAAAAGATAVTAGITTGTIVTGVILAAAVAAAIAASGGGVSDEYIPTKTAEQQATENLQKNTSTTTQSATSQTALTLNSQELTNLAQSSGSVLAKSYNNVKLSEALSGVTVANYNALLSNPASNLSKYLTGLQAADPAAYTAFKATLDSIVARGSNSALSSLANLATSVETDPNGTNAVSAVQTVLKDAQTNYATMMETMLATLHPGYYATVKHVGNQVYVTTLHKKQ